MVSFCHGQEHDASLHRHIIGVGSDLVKMTQHLPIDATPVTMEDGQRIELNVSELRIDCWLVTTDYSHHSAIRRLLRSADVLILFYDNEVVSDIEDWMKQFQFDGDIISVVDNFDLLEVMNKMYGTLTTSFGLRQQVETLLDQMKDGK